MPLLPGKSQQRPAASIASQAEPSTAPHSGASERPRRDRTGFHGIARAAAALLVFGGVAACVWGLGLHRMWRVLAWPRLRDALVLAALALALAWLLRRWRGGALASGLAVVWGLALVYFAGAAAVVAALLLALAAIACGGLLLPRRGAVRHVLALPVGLVLIGAVTGWLLPWPIHHAYVYAPLLLGLCLWRAAELRRTLRAAWRHGRVAMAAAPMPAAGAVLLLGLASVGAWLPTIQADDLAYHLALPSELARHGVYLPDPALQIWALAPWLGDVLQGIAQVLAAGEARGAVDALWLLAAASALWGLCAALGAAARTRWLTVALFASLPLLAALLGGMQTELPATALLLALATATATARGHGLMLAGATLAAGLAALKFGHAVAALVLLIWALVRVHGRIDVRRLPVALLLFLALAGSSYFYAWLASGNPMLPLFNHVFRSDLLAPEQLDDPRWHAGFGPGLPWSLTFATSRYLEARDGAFGFVLVALGGAWLLALGARRTRGLAVAASAVLLLPLLPMQYARYAFPGLVLLLPPLLLATEAALGPRISTRIVVALCALNLAFQANANWAVHAGAARRLVRSGGDATEIYRRYAPERFLIDALRARDPGHSVVLALDPQAPYVAELGRRGRSVAWYAPRLAAARAAADADASGAQWQRLIDDLEARWLLLRSARLSASLRAGLARSGAQRVLALDGAELWTTVAAESVAATDPP